MALLEIEEWIPVIALVAGIVSSIISYLVGRRERSNESVGRTATNIADSYSQLVEDLNNKLDRLEERNNRLEERVTELEHIKTILERRIKELEVNGTGK